VEGTSVEGAPSLGTLEDMLRKAPGTDICLHGAPFQPRTWNQEGAHIPGTLKDEWRAPLLETPKDMSSKAWKWTSASTGNPLLGNMVGRSFLRAFLFRGNL